MDDKVTVYMRFYVADYIADTRGLTLEQKGAYTDLLCHMWKQGGHVPLDHEMLWRLVGADSQRQWERIWSVIRRYFTVNEASETFTQRRLLAEREAAIAGRTKRAEAGSRGGIAKAANRAAATPLPEVSASNATAMLEQTASNPMLEHCSTPHPSSVNRHPSDPSGGSLAAPEPLTLAIPEPAKRKREPTRTDQAMGIFRNAWQDHNGGRKWVSEPGVVPQLVKVLDALAEVGEPLEEFAAIVAAYMADSDTFVAQQGYSLAFLINGGRFTRYRSKRPAALAGFNAREQRNIAASMEFLREGK